MKLCPLHGIIYRLGSSLTELKRKEESLSKAMLVSSVYLLYSHGESCYQELRQLKEQLIMQQHQLKDASLQCQNLQQQLSRVQHSLTTVIRYVNHMIHERSHDLVVNNKHWNNL